MTAIPRVVFVVGNVAFKCSFYSSVCFHGNGRLSLHEEPESNTALSSRIIFVLISYIVFSVFAWNRSESAGGDV